MPDFFGLAKTCLWSDLATTKVAVSRTRCRPGAECLSSPARTMVVRGVRAVVGRDYVGAEKRTRAQVGNTDGPADVAIQPDQDPMTISELALCIERQTHLRTQLLLAPVSLPVRSMQTGQQAGLRAADHASAGSSWNHPICGWRSHRQPDYRTRGIHDWRDSAPDCRGRCTAPDRYRQAPAQRRPGPRVDGVRLSPRVCTRGSRRLGGRAAAAGAISASARPKPPARRSRATGGCIRCPHHAKTPPERGF